MKKILVIATFLLIGGSYAASAQSKATETAGAAATPYIDTNTNAQTNNYYSPDKYTAGTNGTFSVQATSTKIAASSFSSYYLVLQSTVDGTNWNNLECPCSFGGVTTTQDTVTIANSSGAQSAQWHCTGIKAKQLRVQAISTGSSLTFQNKLLYIKD